MEPTKILCNQIETISDGIPESAINEFTSIYHKFTGIHLDPLLAKTKAKDFLQLFYWLKKGGR